MIFFFLKRTFRLLHFTTFFYIKKKFILITPNRIFLINCRLIRKKINLKISNRKRRIYKNFKKRLHDNFPIKTERKLKIRIDLVIVILIVRTTKIVMSDYIQIFLIIIRNR
jgi:hypothetical protein